MFPKHNIDWAFCTFMGQMFQLTFINDIQIIYFSDNNVRDTSENWVLKMMNNSEARKRPFPFPSLLSNEKRDRRNSQSSETSACSSVNTPEDSSKLKCRLCDNKGFKNSEDFDFHLTIRSIDGTDEFQDHSLTVRPGRRRAHWWSCGRWDWQ